MTIKLCKLCGELALIYLDNSYCAECWTDITRPKLPDILESYNPVTNEPDLSVEPEVKRVIRRAKAKDEQAVLFPSPDN